MSTLLGTEKWKNTNIKIVFGNEMEFEEKFTVRKNLGHSNSTRYIRELGNDR